jgi:hypothetical protein
MWTTLRRLDHIPTGEQNQKQRTIQALPKPDTFSRSRQNLSTPTVARTVSFRPPPTKSSSLYVRACIFENGLASCGQAAGACG